MAAAAPLAAPRVAARDRRAPRHASIEPPLQSRVPLRHRRRARLPAGRSRLALGARAAGAGLGLAASALTFLGRSGVHRYDGPALWGSYDKVALLLLACAALAALLAAADARRRR
jgi:hypothetical protein